MKLTAILSLALISIALASCQSNGKPFHIKDTTRLLIIQNTGSFALRYEVNDSHNSNPTSNPQLASGSLQPGTQETKQVTTYGDAPDESYWWHTLHNGDSAWGTWTEGWSHDGVLEIR